MKRSDLLRPAPELAPLLLGATLSGPAGEGLICEVEAYQGTGDRACHASKGRTPRAEVLWAEPGTAYCYLCYGIHVLVNIVCEAAGSPAAILVRGLRHPTLPDRRLNGPGKLSEALGIGLAHNRSELLTPANPVRLTGPLGSIPPKRIRSGPRVGVAYAGTHWANMPWRFWLDDYPAVSQPPYPATS